MRDQRIDLRRADEVVLGQPADGVSGELEAALRKVFPERTIVELPAPDPIVTTLVDLSH